MSVEIINTFTSSDNIKYLHKFLSDNIPDGPSKDVILERLTESIFEFPSNSLIDDSRQNLRHSTDTWTEVRLLNKKFIDDRISFSKSFKDIGTESYHMNHLISDSLSPYGYESINTLQKDNNITQDIYNCDTNDLRLFRYQDPYDIKRSLIPRWQINKRGEMNYDNDSFRESEDYKIKKLGTLQYNKDNINTIDLKCKAPRWVDL
jgi:hypothetical protein